MRTCSLRFRCLCTRLRLSVLVLLALGVSGVWGASRQTGSSSQMPAAYAQQAVVGEWESAPGANQAKPVSNAPAASRSGKATKSTPLYAPQPPSKLVSRAPSVSATDELANLKRNDQLQDQRLAALERRVSAKSEQGTARSQPSKVVPARNNAKGAAPAHGVSGWWNKLTTSTSSSGKNTQPARKVVSGTGAGRTHIVQRGESLGRIASAYGVPVKSMQAANGISNPNLITAGMKLKVPVNGSTSAASVKSEAKPRVSTSSKMSDQASTPVIVAKIEKPRVPVASAPRGVTSYRVESGDTIEGVAQRFATTPTEIRRINNLVSTQLPMAGEEIVVPQADPVSL